jgi:hypothetical protein
MTTMTVEPSLARKPRRLTSDKLDMDRICRLLKVDTLDQRTEWLERHACGSLWGTASEDWTEEQNMAYELEQMTEASNAYVDAVMHVMHDCLDKHGLELVAVPPKSKRALRTWDPDRSWEYRVQPTPGRTWRDVADNVRRTINGVGMFVFDTTREFLDSGPYTAREAVLQHLGWIPDWYDVYEGRKVATLVEGRLR